MKIKQTRQVVLIELLKYVWSNNVKNKTFESTCGDSEVYFNDFGFLLVVESVASDDLFEIEEEVEIDEDTILGRLVVIFGNDKGGVVTDTSISKFINQSKDYDLKIKFIYLQNEDGSIGELIWKDGEMVE